MLKIFSAACLLILCFGTSLSQAHNYEKWDTGSGEPLWVNLKDFSKQELDTAIGLWNKIENDNRTGNSREWTGYYFKGDVIHSTVLRWSPEAGFIMVEVDNCAATLMGLAYGKVIVSPELLEFIFEYHKASASHSHTKAHRPAPAIKKFIPVRWGSAEYLIDEVQIADFGDYVGGFGRYNHRFPEVGGIDFFARRITQPQNNVEELPQVPSIYKRFIKKPIDAEIKVVGVPEIRRVRDYDDTWAYQSHTPVAINVGSLNGVKRGMNFRVLSSDQAEVVTIIRVSKHSSEGVIVRSLDENKQEYEIDPKIRPGWLLSTSFHKIILDQDSPN